MKTQDIFKQVEFEIIDLHQYFQNWFTGKVEEQSYTRVENALDNNFQLIHPSGLINDRKTVLENIRKSYNSTEELNMWVEDIDSRILGEFVLSTYYECHKSEAKQTRRISTAIFSFDLTSIKWMHVHETWCETQKENDQT
ncbi:MAG: hypothetical protein OEZ01_04675 [Candidatus Heimdallarchaeota archaeon]|nr:hypothetical protein [Candidatus Heimdallarchaeota archaeon]MDH5645275.1 hypothetical protein [Candidatus Heimdallarchaeota archaeon]